jgi:hypothetical protein
MRWPLGGGERLLRPRVGQQPGELLAPDPRHGVDRPRLLGDPGGRLGQHAVTHRVAVGVVDRLEVVEIDRDQPRPAAARGLLVQAGGEGAAVEQAGQRVAVGQPRELRLAPRADDHDAAAGPRGHGHDEPPLAARQHDLGLGVVALRNPRGRRPAERVGAQQPAERVVGDDHLAAGDDEEAIARPRHVRGHDAEVVIADEPDESSDDVDADELVPVEVVVTCAVRVALAPSAGSFPAAICT